MTRLILIDPANLAAGYSVGDFGGPDGEARIWDPAAGAFADPPVAGSVRPLRRIAGPDHSSIAYAIDAEIPEPTGPLEQVYYLHPRPDGGPAIHAVASVPSRPDGGIPRIVATVSVETRDMA